MAKKVSDCGRLKNPWEGKLTSWNAKNGSVVYFDTTSPLTLSITSDGVPRSANARTLREKMSFKTYKK